MAGEDRKTARVLELLRALASEPHRFDLFQALRRLECAFRDRPRWGEALRPADEPVRLGQEPSLSFAERAVASFSQGEERTPRLSTFYFGVFGPNGPLPLHLTEYARDRLRNSGDATLARFLDVFHHRMMTLFYRAFADGEPAIARDRPSSDRFAVFVGSLIGTGLPSTRGRGLVSDSTKLHYAGLLAMQTRNADGLAAFVGDLFRVPAEVEQFVGEWVDIPPGHRSRLGRANCLLGLDAVIGTRTWLCESKFRLVLGPLRRDQFERFLPGSAALEELAELVRTYAGDELSWDLRLVLARPEWRAMALGGSRLGWNSWVGLSPAAWQRAEFTFDPAVRNRFAPDPRRPDSSEGSSRPHQDERVEAQAHV
jgi:type VI secretion system protein ImpH